MKEIIITMENKNVSVSQKSSTNGDAIRNEKIAASESPARKSWWDKQSDGVQVIVSVTIGLGAFVALCFVGGTVSAAVKEASARKTMNTDGWKEHERLQSAEELARVQRGLYDEPKTLEEAAARILKESTRQQVIVIDPYEMTQMSA